MQRVLAARGAGSRRRSEDLIRAGRVSVDDQIVTTLGTKVDPRRARIRVDGKLLTPQKLVYQMLNKPRGFITTASDERDRRTVMELVRVPARIYPVGRLDRDTEGLLLLTNDGEVANRVMHPRYGLTKEYQVLTYARPGADVFRRMHRGIRLDDKFVVPDEFRILRETREGLILKIVLHEGMNHVVRRLMEAVEIPIERLRRVRVGPITLAGLALGASRPLSNGELVNLLEALRISRPSVETGPAPNPGPGSPAHRPSGSAPDHRHD